MNPDQLDDKIWVINHKKDMVLAFEKIRVSIKEVLDIYGKVQVWLWNWYRIQKIRNNWNQEVEKNWVSRKTSIWAEVILCSWSEAVGCFCSPCFFTTLFSSPLLIDVKMVLYCALIFCLKMSMDDIIFYIPCGKD